MKSKFLKLILFLLISLLLGPIGAESLAEEYYKDIKIGFRDIKWGADKSTIRNLIPDTPPSKYDEFGILKDKSEYLSEKLYYTTRQFVGFGEVYTRKYDTLAIKQIKLRQIYYLFWKKKFYETMIEFNSVDGEDIIQMYQKRYGQLKKVADNVFEKIIQDIKISIRWDNEPPEIGFITYTFSTISDKKWGAVLKSLQKDEKKEEKDRNTF